MRRKATYDVDGSIVPVFGTESGKAVCNVCPVLASNFVPTWEARSGLVNEDHSNVEQVVRMCAQALDDRSFCRLRGVVIVGGDRGETED